MSVPQLFTEEQKQYLQGFTAGMVNRGAQIDHAVSATAGTLAKHVAVAQSVEPGAVEMVHGTPVDALCREERIKHERNALDIWDTLVANAGAGKFPEGGDVFRYKFHGLFHVAPAQDSFMIRLRMPGCRLSARQMRGLADLAATCGGGYADITTRGNLQIREIPADAAVDMLLGVDALDLTSKGAGADNVRNITCSPTAGFDPNELIDPMPLARAMHYTILHDADLFGLPRKFNIAFDNGGAVSVVADTNDIGLYAVRVGDGATDLDGAALPAGVYFKLQLCGITGHRQFAAETGVLLRPEECVPTCLGVLRLFIEYGDRTNRKKARLKYLVDDWGLERFVSELATRLHFPLRRVDLAVCESRRKVDRLGHVGVHAERTSGLNYVGVHVPVGRLASTQMRRIADLADLFGRGDLRLTVWQNLIIPGVADCHLAELQRGLESIGLSASANPFEAGLVACTGSAGCKYGMANTKGNAAALATHLSERLSLDTPINIHLTGCSHSCAQHYCGDIGLMGVKVKRNGESVDGYNMVLGGGVDDEQAVAVDFVKGIAADELPIKIERLVRHYLTHREADEPFVAYTRRTDLARLKQAMEA